MAAPRRSGPKSSTYDVQIWLIINYSKPQFLHLHNKSSPSEICCKNSTRNGNY